MKCPHCGAELQEHARFCLYCMERLDRKDERKPIKKRKIKWLLWLEVALVALLIAVLLLLCFCKEEKSGNKGAQITQKQAPGAETERRNHESEPTEMKAEPSDPIESQYVGEENEPQAETDSREQKTTQPLTQSSATQEPTQPQTTQTPTTQATSGCLHYFTEATCISSASCIYCGETYGEVDESRHNWQDVTITVHHEEAGHYEEVLVEYVKIVRYGCGYCSAEVDSFDALVRHFEKEHSNIDNYAWHLEHLDDMCEIIEKMEPVYETQWIVDKPAYDETIVIGRKCKLCGMEQAL